MAKRWSAEDVAKLSAGYAQHSNADLAARFGVSVKAICAMAHKQGLRKSPHYLARLSAYFAANPGSSGRFVPGHAPWNVGVKFKAGGRSTETQFKPGAKPHTWNPIGTERITAEGYLERKMTDTGVTRRDYVSVHVLCWTEKNGPVPRGHVVAFRDGNPGNLTIENLELISRKELMRRNTRHRLPPELNTLIQLRGVVTRQINKMEGKHA
jgi:hypothetical protein